MDRDGGRDRNKDEKGDGDGDVDGGGNGNRGKSGHGNGDKNKDENREGKRDRRELGYPSHYDKSMLCVYRVITYSRIWINRVSLRTLLVVS